MSRMPRRDSKLLSEHAKGVPESFQRMKVAERVEGSTRTPDLGTHGSGRSSALSINLFWGKLIEVPCISAKSSSITTSVLLCRTVPACRSCFVLFRTMWLQSRPQVRGKAFSWSFRRLQNHMYISKCQNSSIMEIGPGLSSDIWGACETEAL